MTISLLRGAQFGAGSGLVFAVIAPLNNWLHHEAVSLERLIVGTVFAFFFFGLIGTFTDKIESEIGDI